ncbi:MAG: type II toxin-antitoxin system VapC family toxin [Actinomycetota bacterium]|nr:type II toxin-antitoxin system VapC family toxin [Actinomycetota bacterium]
MADTSVLIELERLTAAMLPDEVSVSTVTLAELAAGPHAATDPEEAARRQARLQLAEATFEALPIDARVARAYGRLYATAVKAGRKARGHRAMDLLIAATALSAELPLYTCNPSDFGDLTDLVQVRAVSPAAA